MDDCTRILCPHCSKIFSSCKLKNRHIKRVHGIVVENLRKSYMFCPLCEERNELKTYKNLREHLENSHQVCIQQLTLQFCSTQEYEIWKKTQDIETNYVTHRTCHFKGYKEVHYECNRSSNKGYQPKQCKRTEKSGGSIKINGVCPSKLLTKIYDSGDKVIVNFWKTHAGHDTNDLRSTHLSTSEKEKIVEKLQCGISVDRILEDARNLKNPKLERINLLSRKDINYLSRKYNIDKRRDNNEMVAAALKISEWNADGKNFAFFFKQQGETHDVLKKEDFALGFMNSVMEEKLKNFTNIICMDGTHGTNKKGMDLTIMLIKDDKNAGFPVAFFLSNRLDQQVQEVFIGALKNKIQQEIKPEYFMSDDDPKYYNAWVKSMGNKPRRLLCTWHVVKNWNIQGKNKIRDLNMKKQMKIEMRQVLMETSEERFIELSNTYLEKLREANEVEFRNYLLKYYFYEERVQMWAHCYRRNAGINTNMALESLNNILKTNQLKRKARVTIEKLLDAIEDLVDIKMWQRILNIERPNANNYQDRIIIKAHKKAEATKDKIEVVEKEGVYGEFQVKSSKSNNIYNVCFKKVCESECKTLFCRVCKVCIHRYECDCPEYLVRNTMCKHVHLVRMHEEKKGSNCVVDSTAQVLGQNSQIKLLHQEEIAQFVEEKVEQAANETNKLSSRSIWISSMTNWFQGLDNVDDNTFNKIKKEIEGSMRRADEIRNKATTKRKMEKQHYFPTKRSRNE